MNAKLRLLKLRFGRPASLRSHLTLLIVAVVIPLLAFSVWMLVLFARNERATFQRGAIERTRALLTAVDSELKGSSMTLEALATSPNLDTGNLRAFYEEAGRILKRQPDWITINLAVPSGQQVVNVLRPFGAELPMIPERWSLEKLLRTGEPVVGGLLHGPVAYGRDFAVRVPVTRDGVTKYVLSAVVKPEAISALLAAQKLPPDWVSLVLDGNNRIVASTGEPERALGGRASESLRTALASASEGWFRGATIEGLDAYTSYAYSPFSNWTVAIDIPAAAVDASLRRSLVYVASFGVISLVLGIALAWFFGSRTARSMGWLARMAAEVGSVKRTPANSFASGISEVEGVKESLLTASRVIRERSEERDRLEQALRRQANLLELTHDAIFVWEFARGAITYWNRGAEVLYDYSKAEAIGKSVHELLATFHPRGIDFVRSEMEREGRWDGELTHATRDGRTIVVASHHVVVGDAAGSRLVLQTDRDITDRKRAEEELRESEARLRAVVETAVDGIITIDARGRIDSFNPAAERVFGYAAAEVIGRNVQMLMPDPYRSEHDSYIANYLRTGERKIIGIGREVEGRRKDGATFPMDLAVSETRLGDRRIFTGLVRDITKRKEAEEALRRFNEELEKRVAERTAELTKLNYELLRSFAEREKLEEQLRHAQKMEAVGTLAGGVAHDFNNILTIILGYAQELSGKERDPEGRARSLEVIASAAQRGSNVVKQLLAFASKPRVEERSLDVNILVQEMMNIIKQVFPKTVSFALELDPALPVVHGDPNQLQQVLINIWVNGKDAMPDGGRLLTRTSRVRGSAVRERFPGAGGDYVLIEVSDTGVGMDRETRARIFEPFFTTKQPKGGTGLGLSVVYGIVQAHGGFIDVESERGRGTTFKLYLPVSSQPIAASPGLKKKSPAAASGHGKTIFVVDDEAPLLSLIKTSAEKSGFRVLTAGDGEEAVAVYERYWEEIELVVLDWGLPGFGGREVFRKLKERNPQVKVIGITGYLDRDVRESMLKEGVREFLQKPCLPSEILAKIGEALDERGQRATAVVRLLK